jgi:hypothetical protein
MMMNREKRMREAMDVRQGAGSLRAANWIGAASWIGAAMLAVCAGAGVTAGAQMVLPGGYRVEAMPAAAAGAGQGTQPQVKDDLFAGTEMFAKGASDVTEITMDPDTLDLVGGKDGKKAHSMILNVVRTYTYDKPGMYRIEDVDAFRNKLNTGDWHCSVHTRDLKTGESTDVCNKRRTDGLAETAIITVEPKQLTFIHTIRKQNGEQGEFNGLLLMNSLPGVSSLAMLDPEQFIDMKIAMARMHVDSPAMQAQIDSAMANLPKLNSAEVQKRMDEAMKRMRDAQKRWQDMPNPGSSDGSGAPGGKPKLPE